MEYHHGNLKDALIHAGEEELKNVGLENLSLRVLAEKVGVSHNAPYRHFQNKAELIRELIEKSLKEWSEQILSAPLLYPASIRLQMQYVGRLYAHTTIRHPRKAHLLMSGTHSSYDKPNAIFAGHQNIIQNISSILEAARREELIASAPIELLACHFVAAFRGLCIMYLTQAHTDLLSTTESLLEISDEISENILRPYLS